MKTIVQISDIHFGKVNRATVKPLIAAVKEIAPTVVVVSGDLTQRAHSVEFKMAQKFLEQLPKPQIVIPGNHDIPMYNLASRFLHPLANYRRYITKDMFPFYQDEEIAVIGANTARSLTVQNGRINREQVQHIKHKLCGLSKDMIKVVVTHHPFDIPKVVHNHRVVGRSKMAMKQFSQCGADLFLAGHLHITWSTSSSNRYKLDGYSALIVHAGTAISSRGRKEPNAFNLITCDFPRLLITPYIWEHREAAFVKGLEEAFEHSEKGWSPVAKTDEAVDVIRPI